VTKSILRAVLKTKNIIMSSTIMRRFLAKMRKKHLISWHRRKAKSG